MAAVPSLAHRTLNSFLPFAETEKSVKVPIPQSETADSLQWPPLTATVNPQEPKVWASVQQHVQFNPPTDSRELFALKNPCERQIDPWQLHAIEDPKLEAADHELLRSLGREKKELEKGNTQPWLAFCQQELHNFKLIHIADALHILASSVEKYPQFATGHSRLISHFEKRVATLMGEMTPGCVSQIVWSYGKLRIRNEVFLNELLTYMQHYIISFEPRHISNTLWGVSKLNIRNAPWLNVICAHSIKIIAEFNSVELSSIAFELSNLKPKDLSLLQAISTRVQEKIARKDLDLQSHHLVNIARAFASLKINDQPLIGALKKFLECRMSELALHNMAMAAYAFTILFSFNEKVDQSFFLLQILREIALKSEEMEAEDLRALAPALCYLQHNKCKFSGSLLRLRAEVERS